MLITDDEKVFYSVQTIFGGAFLTGLYFLIAEPWGSKKSLVGIVLAVIGGAGVLLATYSVPLPFASGILLWGLLTTILLVLLYDIYITQRYKRSIVTRNPSIRVSSEDRQIISFEFYKLSDWAQQLVLYRILAQPQCVISGLVNQLERDIVGIQGAKEKIVDPVAACPLIRKLSDDRISIRDDATRQVLRELFEEHRLLPML